MSPSTGPGNRLSSKKKQRQSRNTSFLLQWSSCALYCHVLEPHSQGERNAWRGQSHCTVKCSQVNWGLRGNRLVTSTLSKSHFLSSTFLLFLLHCLLFSLCGCNFSNFSVDTDYFLFHSWFIVACLCILLFSFMLLFFLISLKIYTSHSYLFKKNNAEYSSSRWGFFYYAISMSFSPWVSSLSRMPAWELWDHGWGVWAGRLSLRVTGQEQPTDRVYFQRHKQRGLCTRMANTWLSLDSPSVSLDKNLIIFTRI